MKYPKGYETTSTQQSLNNKPQDMPDRGGPKPTHETTSTTVNLGRKESPVAAFGAKPKMGSFESTSSSAGLHRNATSPYDNIAKDVPQTSFGGRKKK